MNLYLSVARDPRVTESHPELQLELKKQCGHLLCPGAGDSFLRSPGKNTPNTRRTLSWKPAFPSLPAVAWDDSLEERKEKPKGTSFLPAGSPAWCHQGPSPYLSLPASLPLPATQIFQGRKFMNIYKVLAVREIKKNHLKCMKLDPSINNRPMAGRVPPSPTEGFKFSTRSSGASQSCSSMNTRVHRHTELRYEYTVYTCMWYTPVCIGVTHPHTYRGQGRTLGVLLFHCNWS